VYLDSVSLLISGLTTAAVFVSRCTPFLPRNLLPDFKQKHRGIQAKRMQFNIYIDRNNPINPVIDALRNRKIGFGNSLSSILTIHHTYTLTICTLCLETAFYVT